MGVCHRHYLGTLLTLFISLAVATTSSSPPHIFYHPPRQAPSVSDAETPLPSQTTLYHWPLTSPFPTPLLTLSYDPSSLLVSLDTFTPPPSSVGDHQLTRIGTYDPKTTKSKAIDSDWRGVLTNATGLQASCVKDLVFHLDPRTGRVGYVGFHAWMKGQGKTLQEAEHEIHVRVITPETGKRPHLDRPVLVDAEGREPEPEIEKSMFQK
ncbi:MAG: hypothetical protein M1817_002839 [Caeruleum heppii]|nr:MAG: hypothetical protein M1817_002839 [Caeruleum heppii]